MRKKIFGRQFGRDYGSRQALFRNLTRALILNGKIETTKAKAKAIQGDLDKLINNAKRGGVSSQRSVLAKLANDRETLQVLITKLPMFESRTSGYTRIIRMPNRAGDQAELARIEFVDQLADKRDKMEAPKAKKPEEKPEKSAEKKKVTRKSPAEK